MTSLAKARPAVNGSPRPLFPAIPIKRYSSDLAKEIGEKPMLLLLQLDYVLTTRGVVRYGARRVRLTLDDVAGWFPWSQPTIRRTMTKMIEAGLLDAVQGQSVDRARWIGLGAAAANLEHFTPGSPITVQATSPCDQVDHIEPDSPALRESPRSRPTDRGDHMATRSLNLVQESDQVKDQDHVALAREVGQDADVQEVWEQAKVTLLAMLSALNHRLYIAPLQLGSVRDGTVTLIAPNSFVAGGANRYLSTIKAVLIERLGPIAVDVVAE